jgi:hypothetical protein
MLNFELNLFVKYCMKLNASISHIHKKYYYYYHYFNLKCRQYRTSQIIYQSNALVHNNKLSNNNNFASKSKIQKCNVKLSTKITIHFNLNYVPAS